LIAGEKEGEDVFLHITRKDPASPRNKRLKNKAEVKIRVLASQIRIQLRWPNRDKAWLRQPENQLRQPMTSEESSK
jgi:hypothetical protein